MNLFWKTIIILLLQALLAATVARGAVSTEPSDDHIWFANGDHLHGQLVSIDPSNGVVWKHNSISDTIVFPISTVAKISLGERPQQTLTPNNPCRLRLINQNELEGNLIAFSENDITLETHYAGKLVIPKRRIDSITPFVPNPRIIYEGPTSIDGWTVSSSPVEGAQPASWRYSNGAFITTQSGSIARDLKLPDMASIEFDVAWQNYMSIAIALYANTLFPIQLAEKDNGPDFGAFYSLQVNFNTVNLMMIKKGVPLNSMGIGFLPGIERKTSAHFMIRVNKPERTIYFFIDGNLVKMWQDPAEFAGSGTCIRIVNQVACPLKISNIVVSHWDGRTDTPTNKIDNAKTDFIFLINNDSVSGKIKAFKNNKFIVQAAFGEVEVPFNRISQIHFSMLEREPAPNFKPDFIAFFKKRGSLSLNLERWENGKIIATNPIFGSAAYDLSAFKLLIFKPDSPVAPF